jgi:hypothetical protein
MGCHRLAVSVLQSRAQPSTILPALVLGNPR